MKKIAIILLGMLLAMVILGACSSTENCPAYSEASQNTTSTEEVA